VRHPRCVGSIQRNPSAPHKQSNTTIIIPFTSIQGQQPHVSAPHAGHLQAVTQTSRAAIHCAVISKLVGVMAGERDLAGTLVSVISVLMHTAVVMEHATVYVLILN